jgi:hypothetical protein
MIAPLKERRAVASAPIKTSNDDESYRPPNTAQVKILRLIQRPFGAIFWFIEQRIARIEDKIDNTRGRDQ